MPGVGAPVLPLLGEKYPAVRHEIGGGGVIKPRLKFGCRPEITTFVSRAEAG